MSVHMSSEYTREAQGPDRVPIPGDEEETPIGNSRLNCSFMAN